jgi:hypothetical protein
MQRCAVYDTIDADLLFENSHRNGTKYSILRGKFTFLEMGGTIRKSCRNFNIINCFPVPLEHRDKSGTKAGQMNA